MLVPRFTKATSQSSIKNNNPTTSGRGKALFAYSANARISIGIRKVPNFQVNKYTISQITIQISVRKS